MIYIQKDTTLSVGDIYIYNDMKHVILSARQGERSTALELSEIGATEDEVARELDRLNRIEKLSVEYKGNIFSVNDKSRARMNESLTYSRLTGARLIYWTTQNNGRVIVSVGDIEEILKLGMMSLSALILGVANG